MKGFLNRVLVNLLSFEIVNLNRDNGLGWDGALFYMKEDAPFVIKLKESHGVLADSIYIVVLLITQLESEPNRIN